VEGGRETLQSFIDENLWDEARVFIGNGVMKDGTKAPVISSFYKTNNIQDDKLIFFWNHD
jgi:diaminohydroxyphosphoribosylaminopyrimidine deaminase/5-amino-6-(5-phosphoribosylamino)uracil reductase